MDKPIDYDDDVELVPRLRQLGNTIINGKPVSRIYHRSADRIEALEAALRFYAESCSNGFNIYANLMGPSGDYGEIARAALGEKKDG